LSRFSLSVGNKPALFFQQASNLNGTSGLFTETAKAALTENLRAQAPDTSRGETEDFSLFESSRFIL
jgi:hypothetical protein